MEEAAQRRAQSPSPEPPRSEPSTAGRTGDDLVNGLADGDHPVEAGLHPERTFKILQECIDRGYVHIKFSDTKGGTELGVRLDRDASDLSQADFASHTGTVHLCRWFDSQLREGTLYRGYRSHHACRAGAS